MQEQKFVILDYKPENGIDIATVCTHGIMQAYKNLMMLIKLGIYGHPKAMKMASRLTIVKR